MTFYHLFRIFLEKAQSLEFRYSHSNTKDTEFEAEAFGSCKALHDCYRIQGRRIRQKEDYLRMVLPF